MRVIFIFGLCFFYISPLILGDTIEINGENAVENLKKAQNDGMAKKLTFMDLNVDCQVLIVANLNAMDLLSLAEAINTPLYAIEYVFKRRYDGVFIQDIRFSSGYLTPKSIRIDFSNVSIFLRTFGHLFNHLGIRLLSTDKLSENDISNIFHLVNTYCSKSLTTFTVQNLNYFNLSLEAFKLPFEQVKVVSLSGSFDNLSSSNLSFTDIFPVMQEFNLGLMPTLNDRISLQKNFPNLNTLNAHIWNVGQRFDADLCEKLIRNNPQIRELRLQGATRSVLKVVADELVQLDYLKLKCYEGREDETVTPIHFTHLKALSIHRLNMDSLPARLIFDQLEEFSMGTEQPCNRWLNLVTTQKTLKVLRVKRDLTWTEFAELANTILGLVEVEINCPSDTLNLCQIVNDSQHLQRLILRSDNINVNNIAPVLDSLHNQLSNEWIVRASEEKKIIYVERAAM